jgi:hypothetical protein
MVGIAAGQRLGRVAEAFAGGRAHLRAVAIELGKAEVIRLPHPITLQAKQGRYSDAR